MKRLFSLMKPGYVRRVFGSTTLCGGLLCSCLLWGAAFARNPDERQSDDIVAAMLFSFREATQFHLTAHAIGLASLNGAPMEQINKHCVRAIESFEGISVPTLTTYLSNAKHDAPTRNVFEQIQLVQQKAIAEMQAIKAMAASGNAQAEKDAFLAANREYNEVVQAVASAMGGLEEKAKDREAPTRAAERAPSGKDRAEFPISWRQFQQITGPEGGQTRYIRDADDELRRIEVRTGGDLLFAVTKVDSGFRLTIGQELAVADIASRGLLSGAESDALIEVYSELQGNGGRNRPERTAGRFRFTGERDPEFRIKPSIVISPSE